MKNVKIGGVTVSKFIIGGNPFSGFSHQSIERDGEMRHYYTTERIKRTLRTAEKLGVRTHISRADHHVIRYLMEYWDEGGKINWLAQTCPEVGSMDRGVQNAISGGASGCHIHGGVMDYLVLNNDTKQIPDAIKMIRDAGLVAGIAGHNPKVFQWAHDHLDVDYFMCSHYNPTNRAAAAEHVHGAQEWFNESDRTAMMEVVAKLQRPVIHYKILAAGRNKPADAFAFAAAHMKPSDAVCIGVFMGDDAAMIRKDIALLDKSLAARGKKTARKAK